MVRVKARVRVRVKASVRVRVRVRVRVPSIRVREGHPHLTLGRVFEKFPGAADCTAGAARGHEVGHLRV